jgi:hypothetical protein
VELFPAGVGNDAAGKAVDALQLDAMRHRDRLALARQQHEQSAGTHAAHAEHAAGDGIHPAEVVEQPGVGAGLVERGAERRTIQVLQRVHS